MLMGGAAWLLHKGSSPWPNRLSKQLALGQPGGSAKRWQQGHRALERSLHSLSPAGVSQNQMVPSLLWPTSNARRTWQDATTSLWHISQR